MMIEVATTEVCEGDDMMILYNVTVVIHGIRDRKKIKLQAIKLVIDMLIFCVSCWLLYLFIFSKRVIKFVFH